MTFGIIMFVCVAGIVAYELASGKVLNRSWSVCATRKENAGEYWFRVAFHLLVVFVVFYGLLRAYIAGTVR